MKLVYRYEKPLFAISLTISLLFWLVLILGTFGLALVYIFFFFIFYLFVQSGLISYLKGTAVRITPQQFKDLSERVEACCRKLGMQHVPEAYLLHGDGIFNAFATRFLGRNFIVLYADVVDALEAHPGAINFYIGHELGHLHRSHLVWAPVLFPSGILPILGAAYSRARESTCDIYGLACCEDPHDATLGVAALAAGGKRWRTLDRSRYAAQAEASGGFWMSFHELTADYPWLVKRMARILSRSGQPTPRIPRRNPLAWLFALFVPRVGIASAGGGLVSMMVVVMIIGILAAIAIPAYQDYVVRAHAAESVQFGNQVRDRVTRFIVEEQRLPISNAEVGLEDSLSAPGIARVQIDQEGQIVMTLAGNYPALVGKTIVYQPHVQDGQLYWTCTQGTLAAKYRPAECRGR